jgi:hypothetical protein
VEPDTCQDWTTATGASGHAASAGAPDSTSVLFTVRYASVCSDPMPLYCLGIDEATFVAPPHATGRLAFISDEAWIPGGGLASADALCQSDATAARLDGTYRAMLAVGGASAASRFDTGGAPWVRVDGVALAATAADLFTAPLLDAAPNVTADGQGYLGNYLLWSGAYASSSGTLASTCQSWAASSPTGQGQAGISGLTETSSMYGAGTYPCDTSYARITCLQE